MAGLAIGVVVKGLRVLDKDIITLDVEEGVLSKISRVGLLVVVLVNQVGLGPEWAQASSLERLPPLKVLGKGLVPNMNLKLQLPERKRPSRGDIGREEGRNRLEFPALDINLQDVNVGVTVLSHQRFQGEHGWVFVGLVRTCESNSAEVRAMGAVEGDLRTEGLDAEVVSPDLAVVGVGQDLSLER